jgi:hypothetical protein
MKTIIAGSRSGPSYSDVERAIQESGFKITEVVSGAARGVDRHGETWGRKHKIPVERFPAKWSTHGRHAGFLRNTEMAEYADALIAVWDGLSIGTKNMIDQAETFGLHVHILIVEPDTKPH